MTRMRRLVLLSLLAASSAAASPPYSLGGLLVRAQTVAIVQLDASDAHRATFHAERLYRGRFDRGTRLNIDQLPEHVTRFVAVSQGDAPFGPPTADAQIGQGTEGQRGFRGWLLYPVRRVHGHDVVDPALLTQWDGELRIDRLGALIAKHPYRPAGE
jgi:hypothetical protein